MDHESKEPGLVKRSSAQANTYQPLTKDGMVSKRIIVEGNESYTDSAGNGPLPPLGSTVEVHYTGRLDNLSTFDSSRGREQTFKFKLGALQVILGWEKAVATMRHGERAEVRIAPDYGYGSRDEGPIPANSTLTFDIELLGWQMGTKPQNDLKDNDLMMSVFLIAVSLMLAAYFIL